MKKGEKGTKWQDNEIEILKIKYKECGANIIEIKKTHAIRKMANRLGLRKENKSVNIKYFKNWSSNMAYILGYIWADGCISKNGYQLNLRCHSKDEEIILQIHSEIKSKHSIHRAEANKYKNSRSPFNSGPITSCSIASKDLVDDLKSHGLKPAKTYLNLPFPKIPDKFLPHFIRGYFDGDGSINIRTRIKDTNKNYTFYLLATEQFAKEMQSRICNVLLNITKLPIRQKTNQNQFIVVWYKASDIKAICEWIYPSGEYIFLKRKREKLESILKLGGYN